NTIGMTGFADPLDLTEDTSTGNLYVAEYSGARIMLLRPDTSKLVANPRVSPDQPMLVFNDVKGGGGRAPQTVLIKNRGKHALEISSITLVGDERSLFKFVNKPALPMSVAAAVSIPIKVSLAPASKTSAGIHIATLRIKSNHPLHPTYNIPI